MPPQVRTLNLRDSTGLYATACEDRAVPLGGFMIPMWFALKGGITHIYLEQTEAVAS
jgi:hypothetical protein